MPTIRIEGIEHDSHLPCDCHIERSGRRRIATHFAPLSVEERSYLEARQAIAEGRMTEFRDELDWRENNARLHTAAKISLASAAVLAATAMAAVVWVMGR